MQRDKVAGLFHRCLHTTAMGALVRNPVVVIWLLAFAIRCTTLAISWHGGSGAWNLETDSGRYISLADSLERGDGFSLVGPGDERRPEYLTLPTYPLFLAAIKLFSDNWLLPALLVQCAICAIGPAVVYFLTSRVIGRRAGVAAGLIMCVDFQSVTYSNLILTDGMSMVFVTLAFAALWRYFECKSLMRAGVCGVVFAVAIFMRPVNVFLPLGAAIGVIAIRPRLTWRKTLSHLLVLVLLAGLPTILWSARNWVHSGSWFFETTSDVVLVRWQAARLYMETHRVSLQQARKDIADQIGIQGSLWGPLSDDPDPLVRKKARTVAMEMIRAHPWTFFRLHMLGVARVAAQPDENTCFVLGQSVVQTGLAQGQIGIVEAFRQRWHELSFVFRFLYFGQIPYLAVLWLFATLGACTGIRQAKFRTFTILLVAGVLLFILTSGGYPGDPRYRLPTIPLLVMLAVLGASAVVTWVRGQMTHRQKNPI